MLKIFSLVKISCILFFFLDKTVVAFSFKRLILKNKLSKIACDHDRSLANLELLTDKILRNKGKKVLDFELFAFCEEFLKTYRQYEKNEIEVEKILNTMKSDPLKYAKILRLSVEVLGSRETHSFSKPFSLNSESLAWLNFLSKKFRGHTDFNSLIIALNRRHKEQVSHFERGGSSDRREDQEIYPDVIMAYPLDYNSSGPSFQPSAPPIEAYEANYDVLGTTYDDYKDRNPPPSYREVKDSENKHLPVAYPIPSAPPL